MSRQSNTFRSNKVAPAPKPYCAHCFNLGKPESAYTSHFIRASPDPKSPVVCPELLSTECRYCFKTGHTTGKCPVLAERKVAEEREAKQKERDARLKEQQKQMVVKKQAIKGKFAALESSEDDSEDEMTLKVSAKVSTKKMPPTKPTAAETFEEKFPALPTKPKASSVAPALSNYAGMAAKSKSEYEDEQLLKAKMTKRVEMPTLKRNTNINERQVDAGPESEFWKDFDSDFEDEAEYAARKIAEAEAEDKRIADAHKKKIMPLKASEMDWAALDSDDEDW